jgi:hypothetical protein
MTFVRGRISLLGIILILAHPTGVQQSPNATVTEPSIITLASLYEQADTVAVVKVLSGDAQNYRIAVYKADVVKSFKGATTGDTIYFGPYVGQRLGWEYVLFLRNVPQPIAPKSTSSATYGTVRYSEVFNEGYSSMTTSYKCVFDGKTTAEKCDDGVRVCTDYIVLPKSTRAFPSVTVDTPFGCRWVRKKAFLSLLDSLGKSKK